MNTLRIVAFLGVLGCAVPASAELSLTFDNGRVTLQATDVTLRQILIEWARLGQTRIVGLEKVVGAPVTLTIVDQPEKKALEILLRSLAGYMAAPRPTAVAGASVYDRLMLLPTSVASAAPAGPRPAAFRPPPPPTFPDPIAIANQEGFVAPDDAQNPQETPVFDPSGQQLNAPADDATGVAPPQPGPLANPLRPYVSAPDPNAPAQPSEETQAVPQGPLTSPRPGVLPMPQQQQQRPRQ